MKHNETVQTADRRMDRISAYAYLMQMRRNDKGMKKEGGLVAEIRKLKGSCTGATERSIYDGES